MRGIKSEKAAERLKAERSNPRGQNSNPLEDRRQDEARGGLRERGALLFPEDVLQRDMVEGDVLEPKEVFVKYVSRWLMLGLFCFAEGSNALLWVSFAPISDITSS